LLLATLDDGTRDGRLVIVSEDHVSAVKAACANSLLEALENWKECEPLLRRQAATVASNTDGRFAFDPHAASAPLPRAPQWLDASAYRTHSELVAQAWQIPNPFNDSIPLMYQGASDDFRPAHGPSYLPDESHEIDLEAEIAVIVDDVPLGVSSEAALRHIKLVMLANDVSLRAFGPAEFKAGFGFIQAKPSTVFSPWAVTPDALGVNWAGGRFHGPVSVHVSGAWIGSPNARHMAFSFGDLIAHAAKTRRLRAGTIVGSGTIADPDRNAGSATLAEVRAVEKINYGDPRTPFLKFGDRVSIEALDATEKTIFGRIDHPILRSA
jgi:fumarylacetoacetate (FAA) hydrolase